ncbi:MAG: zf-HC2 domain-containing protein [Candidatus Heteroscillospira sp.]
MNELSCEVCRDLMPLVKDGVASEESRKAVEAHLAGCETCRAMFGGEAPPAPNGEMAFQNFRRQLRLFSGMLMVFGIFFGLGLTAGNDMFYNSLIMPVIGAVGYFLFRRRALYAVPVLLFITHGLTNLLGLIRGAEHLDIYSLLMWTALYSFFALLGALIAALLHYALRKEK